MVFKGLQFSNLDEDEERVTLENTEAQEVDLNGCHFEDLHSQQTSATIYDSFIPGHGELVIWTAPGRHDREGAKEDVSNVYWRNSTNGLPRQAKLLGDRDNTGIRLVAGDGSTMVELRRESFTERQQRLDNQPRKVTSMVVYASRDRAKTPRFGSIWDKVDGKYWPHPDPEHQAIAQKSIETRNDVAQFAVDDSATGHGGGGIKRNPLRDSFVPSSRDSTLGGLMETSVDLGLVYSQPTEAQPVHFEPAARPYKDIETGLCCSDESLCCLSRLQGPCQARCLPGGWLPCVRAAHGYDAEWQIPNAGPANIFDLTLSAIKAMPRFSGELVAIDIADRDKLYISTHVYTNINFVDKMSFEFEQIVYRKPGMSSVPGTKVILKSCSSGFCPASCPLSCIASTVFCWLPFCDTQYNATRVDRVKDLVARSLRAEMRVEV
eukprot:m.95375 g.95375  ORF g.95375 m.95375 type:complete len:435 (-) comp15015_c0_seq1:1035-2339(-)